MRVAGRDKDPSTLATAMRRSPTTGQQRKEEGQCQLKTDRTRSTPTHSQAATRGKKNCGFAKERDFVKKNCDIVNKRREFGRKESTCANKKKNGKQKCAAIRKDYMN